MAEVFFGDQPIPEQISDWKIRIYQDDEVFVGMSSPQRDFSMMIRASTGVIVYAKVDGERTEIGRAETIGGAVEIVENHRAAALAPVFGG